VRDDHDRFLHLNGDLFEQQHELAASRELGWNDMAQAAESNVCAALIELDRHAEAALRAQALLQRIDADGGDSNGNLPWALNVLIEALTPLARFDEARTLAPRALAASRRFGTTAAWQGILSLVLQQKRFEAVGRLVGHVRSQWADSGATPDRDELARVEQVEAAVRDRFGVERPQDHFPEPVPTPVRRSTSRPPLARV